MPNIASVLKVEMLRLAGKVVRSALKPLKSEKMALKRAVRDLRKRILRLEKDNELLLAEQKRYRKLVVSAIPADALNIRVTAKGMCSLRRRLGLTQVEFARLLGVTSQTIWMWERKQGSLRVKDETKKRIYAIRDIGAREARQRVGA